MTLSDLKVAKAAIQMDENVCLMRIGEANCRSTTQPHRYSDESRDGEPTVNSSLTLRLKAPGCGKPQVMRIGRMMAIEEVRLRDDEPQKGFVAQPFLLGYG
jgi:hypothetical protein